MTKQEPPAVTFVAVGDVSPRRQENPESVFALNAHVIREADIAFCQLETTYSTRGYRQVWTHPADRHPVGNVAALKFAGFNVVSFAGNHCLDYGEEGFFDTIDRLQQNGMQVIGVGKDLSEARRLTIIQKKGIRVGFLAYNSVLPLGYAAAHDRPGCAPLKVATFYEQVDWQPGTPPKIVTLVDREDLEAMREDIRQAKRSADVVIVSQHAGVHMVPAVIAMYQKEIAHAAIDEGADLVLQHHSHILKGIEVYKGKAIFYGMCNFGQESPHGKMLDSSYVKKRHGMYQVDLDPAWVLYPYHPDARKTLIVKAIIADGQIQRVTFLPCLINQQVQAEILLRGDKRSQEVVDYLLEISESQKLDPKFSWVGDEVLVAGRAGD